MRWICPAAPLGNAHGPSRRNSWSRPPPELIGRNDDQRPELYIDTGKAEANERIFDQLLASKDEIETAFGGPLEWQRLEGRQACRIRCRLTVGGLTDQDRWPEIQAAMIDAMVRLEQALKPHIKRLWA
ncbi:MAG: DUF4268 domain-containing protein [Chloroflexi bacterium]|nr:DUF4268 domain-containing protein [Chloroflexota bacterium]MBU1748968.1 DUF4268 domain-containing protein [Chloroflexota bacterium]